jgi:hypothetical protein
MKTSYSARKIEERELQKLADTAGDMEALLQSQQKYTS